MVTIGVQCLFLVGLLFCLHHFRFYFFPFSRTAPRCSAQHVCLGGRIMYVCAWKCFCCSLLFGFSPCRNKLHSADKERKQEEDMELLSRGLAGGHEDFFTVSFFSAFFAMICFSEANHFLFSFSVCTLNDSFSFISQCFCLLESFLRFCASQEKYRPLKPKES